MSKKLSFWSLAIVIVLAGLVEAQAPRRPIKIYISTDLEGASGVYKFAQTRETQSPLYRPACGFLMEDIRAVVRGLRDAGVQEIIVLDGHGAQAFVPELMEPGAKYITGKPRPEGLWGLDNTFSGLILLGFHAMKGTEDGVLNHTQSSKSENRYWYNGVESGEIAQEATVASHFGVPPIMVTGDEATCCEARKFFGEPCVTVATKKGLAREAAMLYPFEETHKALYEGAKRAVAAIPACKPYTMKFPVQAKKQWLTFDADSPKGKLNTKEGEIPDPLHLFDF